VKPPASRSDSSEIYFLGLQYTGAKHLGGATEGQLEDSIA